MYATYVLVPLPPLKYPLGVIKAVRPALTVNNADSPPKQDPTALVSPVRQGTAEVVVEVVVEVLLVVVVVTPLKSISRKFVQVPVDCALIIAALSGTFKRLYPATNAALDTPVANGVVYPSTFEKRLKGPTSVPAKVNVTNTVILLICLV
jgi:hypothetical protein